MSIRAIGKRRLQEAAYDLVVVGTVQGEIEQVVVAEKAVEDFRGQHQRRRHSDANTGEAAADSPLMQQVAYESQAARLSAQRTAANLEEEGARPAETWRD